MLGLSRFQVSSCLAHFDPGDCFSMQRQGLSGVRVDMGSSVQHNGIRRPPDSGWEILTCSDRFEPASSRAQSSHGNHPAIASDHHLMMYTSISVPNSFHFSSISFSFFEPQFFFSSFGKSSYQLKTKPYFVPISV